MTEPRIPASRLSQLARRKLLALGIINRVSEDGQRVEGDIAITAPHELLNPLNGQTITKISFVVEGHDRLKILSPPALSQLPPQPFFEFDRLIPLIEQIISAFQLRLAALKSLGDRLRQLGIEHEVDKERSELVVRIPLSDLGIVHLEGDERGLLALRLDSTEGKPAIWLGEVPIDLEPFSERSDFDNFVSWLVRRLADSAPQMDQVTPQQPDEAPVAVEQPKPAAQQKGILLRKLVKALGDDALVNPGIVVARDFKLEDEPVRFMARHEQGDSFTGRVISSQGVIWNGTFELKNFPGVESFVASLLKVPQLAPVPVPPETGGEAKSSSLEELAHGYQIPVVGEVWVMNFLTESEDEKEIRYVGVNVDGQPFGAPRVLPREAFLSTFVCTGSGTYRLSAEVVEVKPGEVVYFRLDQNRSRVGNSIRSPMPVFLSNFYPEAASY